MLSLWFAVVFCERKLIYAYYILGDSHSRSQRPRSFWSAPSIVTSGKGRSNFRSMCREFVWYSQPIRLSGLSDLSMCMRRVAGKSVNRELSQGWSRFLVLTKRGLTSQQPIWAAYTSRKSTFAFQPFFLQRKMARYQMQPNWATPFGNPSQ